MNEIINGNCVEAMASMTADSFDACITDPPYELGFMGKKWDNTGIAFQPSTWAACLRVLKPGAHLLAFGGTRTFHRIACAIEDAGFEIRDCIMWVYGSGFPKSHNLNGEWEGWGTALKPAWEPIIVARKPLVGTVADNVLKYGTGAINIKGCRVGNELLPSMTAGQAKLGTFERGIMVTPERTGRWPANLIHDGSAEVLSLFPGELDKSAARFFYCPKASKADRDDGLDGFEEKARPTMGSGIGGQPDQQRTNNRNVHPTVKPTELMRYLCRLVTPPGGTILDPFNGSGSTGKAAVLEGFNYVGIEREAEYCDIARARISFAESQIQAAPTKEGPDQMSLFADSQNSTDTESCGGR